MKSKQWILFSVALVLMALTAFALTWFRAHQKLGQPGIIAEKIPGSVMMKINLPERVLDFTSTNVPESETELGYFPPDTSYARRCYTNDPPISATVILMGADRTSIHRPDYCLPGQGWMINEKTVVNLPVAGWQDYQMPVAKWVVSNSYQTPDGQRHAVSGIYVFWFVAAGEQTPDNNQRMWWLGRDLLRSGVLQRWAYVSYFAPCQPGQEDAAWERLKNLIVHSVAEYQVPPDRSRTVKN